MRVSFIGEYGIDARAVTMLRHEKVSRVAGSNVQVPRKARVLDTIFEEVTNVDTNL